MGKKDPTGSKKRRRDEEEEEAEESHDIEQDPELMAEMAALAAIQRERDGMDEVEKDNYNSSGLLKCIDIDIYTIILLRYVEDLASNIMFLVFYMLLLYYSTITTMSLELLLCGGCDNMYILHSLC